MKKTLNENRFWWARIWVDSLCKHLPTHGISLVYHFISEKWYHTQKPDLPSEMNSNDSSSKKGLIAAIDALGENKQKYLPA